MQSATSTRDFVELAVLAGLTVREIDERLAALEYRLRLEQSFSFFAREAWPHVVAEELVWNWHLDAISEHLEAVTWGKIQNLLCNMPPGHGKSTFFSVLWPVWQWVHYPSWQLLSGSYDIDLVMRDMRKSRLLIKGEWFQQTFRPDWDFAPDQDRKRYYENTVHGHRVALTPRMGTGYRANCWQVDDPLNLKDTYSIIARVQAVRWIRQVLQERLNDRMTAQRVMVMQRLHEDDPSDMLIKKGFVHLMLPSEFEPKRACKTIISYRDPRTEEGELLFDAKYPAEVIAEAKLDLGAMGYAGQHQQRPSPEGGNIFKRDFWRFWKDGALHSEEKNLGKWVRLPQPSEFERFVVTVDTSAGSESSTASYNVFDLWGIQGALCFLLAEFRERLTEPKLIAAFEAWCKTPEFQQYELATCKKWIEAKAAGPELIKQLQPKIFGLLPVTPKGKKPARARAAAPAQEARNIILPNPETHPWVDGEDGYIEELALFPGGKNDDRVDSLSMLISQLAEPEFYGLEEHYRDLDGG